MPTWSAWGGGEGQATALAALIPLKSVSTGTIVRGTGTVAAKTVRLETLGGQREMQGENGTTYTVDAMLLAEYGAGFKPGDRFTIVSVVYEVVVILPGHTDCEQVMLKLRR